MGINLSSLELWERRRVSSLMMRRFRQVKLSSRELASGLPPPGSTRWRAWQKAAVVIAVRSKMLTRSDAYDHYMLGMHDAAKANTAYQREGPREVAQFPPGTTWIVTRRRTRPQSKELAAKAARTVARSRVVPPANE